MCNDVNQSEKLPRHRINKGKDAVQKFFVIAI